jgi:hypothetical protein
MSPLRKNSLFVGFWQTRNPAIYLNRHSALVPEATAAPGIHQQIAEPPGTTPIRQSHTNEPYFVAAADRKSGENFIHAHHGNCTD